LEQIQVRVTDNVKTNRMVQQSFESISGIVDKMEQQLKSIGEASKQQELGIQQTNSAMRQMEAAAEENRGSSEKTHRASEELSRESSSLAGLTEELVYFVNGGYSFAQNTKVNVAKDSSSTETKAIDLGSLVSNVASLRSVVKAKSEETEKKKEQYFKKAA
jgi:hypothetical protein